MESVAIGTYSPPARLVGGSWRSFSRVESRGSLRRVGKRPATVQQVAAERNEQSGSGSGAAARD
jgi:hypothetical protein